MTVVRPTEAGEFLRRAGELLGNEARNVLVLGVARTLIAKPELWPRFHLFIVERSGQPVAAALMTEPHRLIVADPADEAAVGELAEAVAGAGITVPGVTGNRPAVDEYAGLWHELTGDEADLEMEQGIYAIDQVRSVPVPAGAPRPASDADRPLLEAWIVEFAQEALPEEVDQTLVPAFVDRGLSEGIESGYWLWDTNGAPRCLSAHMGPTGSGVRIGSVYTPPRFRNRGFATALVAHHSQWLLDHGYRFCFLYTDLSNPTSNALYERIGYYRIGDAAMYDFRREE